MKWPCRNCSLLLSAVLSAEGHAAEGPDFQSLRESVVAVVVRGVVSSLGNQPVAAQGTGFFISKDGFIVTSLHLRAELGKVEDGTVTYEIRLPPPNAAIYNAIPVFLNPAADVLVLYSGVGDMNVKTLQYADRTGVLIGVTDIFTLGYPAGYNLTVDKGFIKSFSGPVAPIPVWTSNFNFKQGQSGSPIILANGRVIAIAKGNDKDAASLGLIVPTRLIPAEYWDGESTRTAEAVKLLVAEPENDSGSLVVEALASADQKKVPVRRDHSFTVSSASCSGTVTDTKIILATPGWAIDKNSVSVKVASLAFGTGQAVPVSISSSQIAVGLSVTSNPCVRVFGAVIGPVIAAQISALVTYTETSSSNVPRFVTVSETAAAGPVKAPLPELGLDKLRFSWRTKNGATINFTPTVGEINKIDGRKVIDVQAVVSRLKGEK